MDDPRVRGRLRDCLTLRTSANGILQDRLGDAVLVDSLESALDLHRSYPATDYLTPEGDVVYSSGVVATGGRKNGDQGLLAHSRRMEEARAQSVEAASQVTRLHEAAEASRREVERLELDLQRSRQALDEAERERVTLELQLQRLEEETQRTDRRHVVLSEELAGLGEESARSDRELRQLRREVDEAEEGHRALEAALERRVTVLDEKTVRLRELAERVAALGAEAAAWQHRQEAVESEGRRLEESAAELEARVRALREEASAGRERSRETAESMMEIERELVERLQQRETYSAETAEMERSINERQQSLAEQEKRLRVAREELEALREKTREAELERTKSEAARAHLDELCRQELGISAREAAEAASDELRSTDAEELETAIEQIKASIEKIGPVNLTAIEEFTELEDRHRFLTEQRQDLEQSMTSLKETIRRINRSSRERFTQAFEAIRDSFHQIFKLLFNGGRADLRLEEGEDVLECGIEIMAQPPGKRLGSVQLLSGGEKALSAIALLFAVFRYQPSPFCLLDEVDAALDDANVGRFARMLREYAEQTQFIVVTHNKLSMESADLMYGVTMEEPGVSKLVSIQFE
jgi:chromosome segregation protein